MRIRRRLPIVLAVLLVAAAVALAVVLRKHAPPEPARLLPGADGFVYVNLQWMRRANITGELPAVHHDPDYEQFIQATGFQFERDLDEAALAQKAYVTADAFGKRRFWGHVVRVGQQLGPKNVRTDEPMEKVDTKILETLVELDPGSQLPDGLRVDASIVPEGSGELAETAEAGAAEFQPTSKSRIPASRKGREKWGHPLRIR